jgi:hypothetical protein
MKKKRGLVFVPVGYKPRKEELYAARIVAKYYNVEVTFLKPVDRFRESTPDFLIGGVQYELKTPRSENVNRIFKLLIKGSKQADCLVVNTNKTAMSEERIISICKSIMNEKRSVVKIIVITKNNTIVELIS